jgi:hypothetical protein
MPSLNLNKLPLGNILLFHLGIFINHKPLCMYFCEQHIHPTVYNMDWTVNDVLEVIHHGVGMVLLEGGHVQQTVEQVNAPLEPDGVQARFVLEVVFVGL